MNIRTILLPAAAFVAAISFSTGVSAAASVAQDVRSVVTIEEDEQTIVIRRENGEVTVEVNGERVPADRVRREGNRLRVVDERGDVITEIQIDGLRARPGRARSGARGELRQLEAQERRERALTEERRAGLKAARPRAQMGVMLGRVDDTLAEQMNVDADEVVLITEILPGLAADKAGIRKHDIIIRVNGDAPATPEKLREIVLSRQPDETIRLEVLREGQTEEIAVTLEPFQTDALLELEGQRAGMRNLGEELREQIRQFYQNRDSRDGDGPRVIDELRMEIEEARPRLMRQWRHLQSNLHNVIDNVRQSLDEELSELQELAENEELNRKLQQAIDQALIRVAEAMESAEIEIEEIAPRIEFFRRDGDELGILIHPHQLPAPPAPLATERRERDRRAQREIERELRARPGDPQPDGGRLDDRFNRLEERLERLERMIRRLAEERASN